MEKRLVLEYFGSNRDFSVVKTGRQHWNAQRFSYLESPRPDHGIMLLLRGKVKLIGRDGILTAKEGDVVFLPQNSRYEAVFEGETEDLLVNFVGQGGLSSVLFPVCLLENAPFLCKEGFRLLLEEKASPEASPLRLKGLLYLLLDSLLKGARSSEKEGEMDRAKALLCDPSHFKISEIASRCGFSESGFRKDFKAAFGLSPNEYRLQYRLERARHLLESTDRSVGEIAEALSFYDAACFCRAFKSYTGLSPLQFSKGKRL